MSVKISGAELEIMEYLWESREKCSFAGLLEYFNEVRRKNWCKQTLNTNLLRLKKRGFLSAEKSGTKTMYAPAVTRVRYEQMCAEEILQESYGGVLTNFIAALAGGEKITESEKQELMKYIQDYSE